MLITAAMTDCCYRSFIESLEKTYTFSWERILDSSCRSHRIVISGYLFEFKMIENTLSMDMYLNMNDPVPIQYQPKLARVALKLEDNWWDATDIYKDVDKFVSMCVRRFTQVHQRLLHLAAEVQPRSTVQ